MFVSSTAVAIHDLIKLFYAITNVIELWYYFKCEDSDSIGMCCYISKSYEEKSATITYNPIVLLRTII